jgi:hypothetical protein
MNASRFACITGAIFALASTVPAHAAPPAVDAARAVRLADDYLAKRGARGNYIASASLESTAIVKGGRAWVVRWAEPIADGEDREVGVRIKLDGSLSRLVENKRARIDAATRRPYLR